MRSACGGCRRCATVDCFHDDPGYIRALARNVNDYWMKHGRPEHLVLCFHGLPRRSLDLGDPYHCQCQKTARLLATELGLDAEAVRRRVPVALRPRRVAEALHRGHAGRASRKEGVGARRRVCPGFVADCLETLEEIGIEGKQAFLGAGGKEFHAIPCLNEHPLWIAALADLVARATCRAGSPRRRTPRRARRRCCGRRRWERGSKRALRLERRRVRATA